MSNRITVNHLKSAVHELNTLLGYTMGQDGSFCLQGAYGGWSLQRRRGSGIEDAGGGYIPKRELYLRINNIIFGAQIAFKDCPASRNAYAS